MLAYVRLLNHFGKACRTPLRDVLFNPRHVVLSPNWSESIGDYGDNNPDFVYPKVFARSTNSVQSARFNPNPGPPREYVVADDYLISILMRWDSDMTAHYALFDTRQFTRLTP
jgi:hypothetical protein